ncbi:MAG: GNAT family N-acetyltransferase [Candidatus Dadabacteria bacterium]|jgi:predicted N-acetyltransferase YhbS|nr:GNAT family N-acetyltransferase [Candidatus Dadabacteria bacterium]
MNTTDKITGELTLVPITPEHAKELGRICFEAFRSIHDRHAFERDFPTIEAGQGVIDFLVSRDDFHGVAALIDGKPVGSNFISFTDPVAGVGPITVDPERQERGIGRALMKAVIDAARERGVEEIRLMQDSFNSRSLSLYASLGFDVREPVALMQAAPANVVADATVRPAVPEDVAAMDELCAANYKVSRRNEIENAIGFGLSPLVAERGGRITGYLIPGFLGHGAAETVDDAAALAAAVGKLPGHQAKFFCPLKEAELYRRLLADRHRVMKVMNLMTLGPYEHPEDVWMPSVFY